MKQKNVPDNRMPYNQQVAILREQNRALRKDVNKMCRLLTAALIKSGGRIEFREEEYYAALRLPDEETGISLRNAGGGRIALARITPDGKETTDEKPLARKSFWSQIRRWRL